MKTFPQTIQFLGTNTPRAEEYELQNLEVIGDIPPDINGAFFRAVPDNAQVPMFEDDVALSADGMISRFLFRDGKVDYAIKFVKTARYLAEQDAGKALFGKYRNPFTDAPSVNGVDRTVANTTPIWHAGRLLMTKEDGHGYEVDPHTLETLGSWDYFGALKSETMTAHPRIDPETGEMFFFGYEAGGLATKDVAYCIADKDGKLIKEEWFQAPYCSSIHDFCITEHYAVFPIFPTIADLDRLKAGGPHWAHNQDEHSWLGVMPRYGSVDEMRWFKGPKGVSSFHFITAFEEDGNVHIDICLANSCGFGFMREAGGIFMEQQEIGGALMRWSVDMSSDDNTIAQRPIGPPGELPTIRATDEGRQYDFAWYLSMNPGGGPPMLGGPVGVNFNALLEIYPRTGRIDMLSVPAGAGINEACHVPSTNESHPGWLLNIIDIPVTPRPDDYLSELWISEVGKLAQGPVAKIKLGVPSRAQVHGTWVNQTSLDAAAGNFSN